VTAAEAAPPPGRSSRRRSPFRLEDDVRLFVEQLLARYPQRAQHRARAFKKRIVSLLSVQLPPYPRRPGRKETKPISRAAELYLGQRREIREGRRQKVNWGLIAQQCVKDFAKILSEDRRARVLTRLRNSTHARLKRMRGRRQRSRRRSFRRPISPQ
jgi:hypothetical protein